MDVKMPDVLAAGGLVVLAGGGALAVVGGADGQGDFFGGLIDFG